MSTPSKIVFELSGYRSDPSPATATPFTLERLGQAEAMFSLAFVLFGPFLLA